jgi:branched-chain amino acid aminotransferase
MSKHDALREGYDDALLLDWRGRIAEATAANIFFVADGELHTPIPDCFLNGLTRQTVIEIARHLGLTVTERDISPSELSGFSECFLTGTASEIARVVNIDEHSYPESRITRQMVDAYADAVRAREDVGLLSRWR